MAATAEAGTGFFRRLPKADRHNHCLLGGKRSFIESYLGKPLAPLVVRQRGIQDLNTWIFTVYKPFFEMPEAFEKAVEAAFIQAKYDGVTVLGMSIDVFTPMLARKSPGEIIGLMKQIHNRVAPELDFRPELGFPRSRSLRSLLSAAEPFLREDFFQAIDLYDDEESQPIDNFRELYKVARSLGLTCKAHAGEFGGAEAVREAVEKLGLDEVQHGIGAAESPEVMRWLAGRGTRLNTCPASNVRLKAVRSYRVHPARILFDHGVNVTVNTDDALIFGAGISEQAARLVRAGLFSTNEMAGLLNLSLE